MSCCGTAQYRDGHLRREAIGPTYSRLLDGKVRRSVQSWTWTSNSVGSTPRSATSAGRKPVSADGRSRAHCSTRSANDGTGAAPNLCDVVAMPHRAHGPIRREGEILGVDLRGCREGAGSSQAHCSGGSVPCPSESCRERGGVPPAVPPASGSLAALAQGRQTQAG